MKRATKNTDAHEARTCKRALGGTPLCQIEAGLDFRLSPDTQQNPPKIKFANEPKSPACSIDDSELVKFNIRLRAPSVSRRGQTAVSSSVARPIARRRISLRCVFGDTPRNAIRALHSQSRSHLLRENRPEAPGLIAVMSILFFSKNKDVTVSTWIQRKGEGE